MGILRIPEGLDINKIPDESETNDDDDDPDQEEHSDDSDDEEGGLLCLLLRLFSSFIANIILSKMEFKRTIYELSVCPSDSVLQFYDLKKINMSDIHNAYFCYKN